MCILVKMVMLRPALYFLKSLPTFKALTVIADISCSQALYSCEAMHYQSCIECFVKISSQFVLTDHMRRCFHCLKKTLTVFDPQETVLGLSLHATNS